MRMLADTLREECRLYDIDVHISFPANILSPGFEVEERTKPEVTRRIEGAAATETPEAVAKHIIQRLEKGQKHITYQFEGALIKVVSCRINADVEYDVGNDRTRQSNFRLDSWVYWISCLPLHQVVVA
jgi:3-dehydrosphinganine reductase